MRACAANIIQSYGQSQITRTRVPAYPRIMEDMVQSVVARFVQEAKKPVNMDSVRVHVLDPIIEYTFGRLYPYIIVTSIIFFLTFVIAAIVLVVVLRK